MPGSVSRSCTQPLFELKSSLSYHCPFQGRCCLRGSLCRPQSWGSALPDLTLLAPFAGWTPGLLSSSYLPTTRVATPQQLFFSGEVKGESAMRSERDVGSKVKYEVTVSILLCGPTEEALGSSQCFGLFPIWLRGGHRGSRPLHQADVRESSRQAISPADLRGVGNSEERLCCGFHWEWVLGRIYNFH